MVCAAGFPRPGIAFNQPVVARGENKRFLELSVAEAGPAFIEAELITSCELERTLVEMRRLARDESVLAIMPRMVQVWAKKAYYPMSVRSPWPYSEETGAAVVHGAAAPLKA